MSTYPDPHNMIFLVCSNYIGYIGACMYTHDTVRISESIPLNVGSSVCCRCSSTNGKLATQLENHLSEFSSNFFQILQVVDYK